MANTAVRPESPVWQTNGPDEFSAQFVETLGLGCADGVYAVDLDQKVVFWSPAAEDLTGRKREEVIGKQCYEVMLGGDIEGHPYCRRGCQTIAAARRGRSVHSYDLQVPTAEGLLAWFNMSIITLRDHAGHPQYIVHMFRDVTNRRVAEILAQDTIAAVARFSEVELTSSAGSHRESEPDLTPRELDVLRLLGKGLTTPQIAEKLGIARATARNHADRLLSKLDAHNRVEAVVRAGRLGLV